MTDDDGTDEWHGWLCSCGRWMDEAVCCFSCGPGAEPPCGCQSDACPCHDPPPDEDYHPGWDEAGEPEGLWPAPAAASTVTIKFSGGDCDGDVWEDVNPCDHGNESMGFVIIRGDHPTRWPEYHGPWKTEGTAVVEFKGYDE